MAHRTGEFSLPDGSNVPQILIYNDGLETIRSAYLEGLQVTPAELYRQVALQVPPEPKKEAPGSTTSDSCSNNTLGFKSSIVPKKRPRWKFWLSMIATALLIVATATAVSVGLHHSRGSRYEEINQFRDKNGIFTMAIVHPVANLSQRLPMPRPPQSFQVLGHPTSPA